MTGTIHWAKVLGDPVPNYNRDGFEWTFEFVPNAEGLALIEQLGIRDKLKNRGDERGDFLPFKQKQQRADGRLNDPITVVDARNRLWDPKIVNGKPTNLIGNGSLVEVKFRVVDYGKGKPTGVYPTAIRVLDLNKYTRQEFAPLPEDNEFVQKAAADEDSVVFEPENVALDDPLNIEEN